VARVADDQLADATIVQGHEDDAESIAIEPERHGPPVDQPKRRPLFAAIVSKDDQRRPIVPIALRRGNLKPTVKHVAGGLAHRAGYHAFRAPAYLWWVLLWGTVGAGKFAWSQIAWWWFLEQWPFKQAAATDKDSGTFKMLRREEKATRLFRGFVLAGEVAVVAGTGAAVWFLAPWWVPWATVAGVMPLLARYGRPPDRPIVSPAVIKPKYRELTATLVRSALVSLRMAAIKEPGDVSFVMDIHRDGPGQMAVIDLPPGVDAVDVVKERGRLASGLRVPVDQCWPETDPKAHPGRLKLWVGYQPASAMKQPPWPLLDVTEPLDVFKPFPLGTDQRLRVIEGSLVYRNWLIGAMPGYGKTFALRLPLLAAALDPTVQLRIYELKGTGDLDMFEDLCTEFGSGADDDTAFRALQMLRALRAECVRRGPIIKRMARIGKAPDNKITRELAQMEGLDLEVLVAAIDECQELFAHPQYGKEAGELAASIIKLGRALGVILLLATQRPDAKSMPTDVSANAGVRLCLRVMGQTENDMILGTSKYKEGIRATMFGDDDYGWAWLVGLGKAVTLRTFGVNGDLAKKVIKLALAFRRSAGTLPNLDDVDEPRERVKAYNLLEDVRAVWIEGEEALWSELIVPRLQTLRPDIYADLTVEIFGARMAAAGVPTAQLNRRLPDGKPATRKGVRLRELEEQLRARAIAEK
jgi:S-DNA-T family DNA segregation ATPase FtsK/SpoIIIE